MSGCFAQRGEEILGTLAGGTKVKIVGAEIDFVVPGDCAKIGRLCFGEIVGEGPGRENAFTNEVAQIRDAFIAIGKAEPKPKMIERANFNDFLHSSMMMSNPPHSKGDQRGS